MHNTERPMSQICFVLFSWQQYLTAQLHSKVSLTLHSIWASYCLFFTTIWQPEYMSTLTTVISRVFSGINIYSTTAKGLLTESNKLEVALSRPTFSLALSLSLHIYIYIYRVSLIRSTLFSLLFCLFLHYVSGSSLKGWENNYTTKLAYLNKASCNGSKNKFYFGTLIGFKRCI